MLGFLVMFSVVRQINCAFIVAIKRRNKRIDVIPFS
jgi:hypothetical protein